jgi:hypothetical protein
MVTNTGPRADIERDGTARAADFRNTNQHLSEQNETGRNGYQQISSAVLSTTQPPLHGPRAVKQPRRLCIQGRALVRLERDGVPRRTGNAQARRTVAPLDRQTAPHACRGAAVTVSVRGTDYSSRRVLALTCITRNL